MKTRRRAIAFFPVMLLSASLLLPLSGARAEAFSGAVAAAPVLDVMERVADWQLAHPSQHPTTDWTQGAGYAGMMALADISPHPRFTAAMLSMGQKNGWQLGPNPYHADDHVVGQTYAELYFKFHDPKMIAPMRARFDDILANPHDGTMEFTVPGNQDRWSWCDALFMAPPA